MLEVQLYHARLPTKVSQVGLRVIAENNSVSLDGNNCGGDSNKIRMRIGDKVDVIIIPIKEILLPNWLSKKGLQATATMNFFLKNVHDFCPKIVEDPAGQKDDSYTLHKLIASLPYCEHEQEIQCFESLERNLTKEGLGEEYLPPCIKSSHTKEIRTSTKGGKNTK